MNSNFFYGSWEKLCIVCCILKRLLFEFFDIWHLKVILCIVLCVDRISSGLLWSWSVVVSRILLGDDKGWTNSGQFVICNEAYRMISVLDDFVSSWASEKKVALMVSVFRKNWVKFHYAAYGLYSFRSTCLCRGFWWVMFSTAKIHFQFSAFIFHVWHCDSIRYEMLF